jgi:RNA recognition motif-containing protein
MNIYVGNISFDAADEDLKAAFEEFGEVEKATVVRDRATGRSRGFGFVEMPDDEDARKAISEMDGKELMGRPLKVNEARPRERKTFRPRF